MKEIINQVTKSSGTIIDVSHIINQQVSVSLTAKIVNNILGRINRPIDRVITIESGGIVFGYEVAKQLNSKFTILKKSSKLIADNYNVLIKSYTKQNEYYATCKKAFLLSGENVLFIDDFLASGNAYKGVINLCAMANANLVKSIFIIEKEFESKEANLTTDYESICSVVEIGEQICWREDE